MKYKGIHRVGPMAGHPPLEEALSIRTAPYRSIENSGFTGVICGRIIAQRARIALGRPGRSRKYQEWIQ